MAGTNPRQEQLMNGFKNYRFHPSSPTNGGLSNMKRGLGASNSTEGGTAFGRVRCYPGVKSGKQISSSFIFPTAQMGFQNPSMRQNRNVTILSIHAQHRSSRGMAQESATGIFIRGRLIKSDYYILRNETRRGGKVS